MEDRSGGAPGGTLLEVVHALKNEVAALAARLDPLEAPGRLRVRELELVDEDGRPVARLVARNDGTAGLECLRASDGALVSFVGALGDHGALQFTGGRHDNVVLDLGANGRGGHFAFLDPDDRQGAKVLAFMGRGCEPAEQAARP